MIGAVAVDLLVGMMHRHERGVPAVAQWHRAAWQQIHQQAIQPAPGQYGFPSPTAYTTLLQPPMSLELPEDVVARLGVELTRVLLVYAEGVA